MELYWHDHSLDQALRSHLGTSLCVLGFMGARQAQPEPHRVGRDLLGGQHMGQAGLERKHGTGHCWWLVHECEAAQPGVLQTWGKLKGAKHVFKIFFP